VCRVCVYERAENRSIFVDVDTCRHSTRTIVTMRKGSGRTTALLEKRLRNVLAMSERQSLRLDTKSVSFVLRSMLDANAVGRTEKLIRRRTLVVHFDVNETIMLGDPAGGDSFDDTINKMLAKNAYIRRKKSIDGVESKAASSLEDWEWYNGTPMDGTSSPPPLILSWDTPRDCVSFYRSPFKAKYAKSFTMKNSPGNVYRTHFEKLKRTMRLPEGKKVDERLTHDGRHFFMIPAFFQTLAKLDASGRDFKVVIRTYGTDGAHIAKAINAWAEGKHPNFEGRTFPSFRIDIDKDLYVGRYKKEDGSFSLVRANIDGSPSKDAASLSEGEVFGMLQNIRPRVQILQDDYFWWRSHGYLPSAGKPLWIDWAKSDELQHIFFDDNIHNDPEDSIVSIRLRKSPTDAFRPLSGESIRRLQGCFLVRVPTVCPIRDEEWFLDKISKCEEKLSDLVRSPAKQKDCLVFE